MRWRQPNAGLARTPCHQSSWVRRSAFLKHEDLIELTPSPRADGWEHSVNAATDYCKQLLVTLIAPLGARQALPDLGSQVPTAPFPGRGRPSLPQHSPWLLWAAAPHPTAAPKGSDRLWFVTFSTARGRPLNAFSFFTELKLSHLWLGERCRPWGTFSHPVYSHGSKTLCALTDYFEYMKCDLMYSIFISNIFCTSWIGMSQTGVTAKITAKRFYQLARVSL